MINKVSLLGRVGRDPEERQFGNGGSVVNLTLATTETWKDKSGERQEKTQWHQVACFNSGLCKILMGYVKKGDLIYIEGQLETRKWQDKDGQDRYTTEVVLRPFSGELKLIPTGNKGGSRDDSRRGSDRVERGRDDRNDDRGRSHDHQAPARHDRGGIDDEIPFN